MGKMKELFMQKYYPNEDFEREFLIERSFVEAQQEEEYLQLKQDLNPPITKIEVANGERQTRIETGTEKFQNNQHVEVAGYGL